MTAYEIMKNTLENIAIYAESAPTRKLCAETLKLVAGAEKESSERLKDASKKFLESCLGHKEEA